MSKQKRTTTPSLRGLVRRFFPKNKSKGTTHSPKIYSQDRHQIQRHLVSRNAIKVCQVLQEHGFQAYIVGGAVRDMLLGLEPKDFDVATNAKPEQIKPLFRRAMIIGRRFRLVHCIFGREIIEVSTFRAPLQHHQRTDEFGRVLSDNIFGTHAEDAARRDFTINALYYDPVREEVIDYHDGVADIKARMVRIIGDARERYREDPVRILRALRFQAKLNGQIEASTAEPIRELAPLIANVPDSRLADETLKLLMCGKVFGCLELINSHQIPHNVLPLIDLLQQQLPQSKLLRISLERTDHRIRANKSVSPSFLYAAALWPMVNQHWQAQQAHEPHVPALVSAANSILDRYAKRLSLQRRQSSDMRDIWFMQPRFERRTSLKAIHRLLAQQRFRAAVDFLQIRAAAGEFDSVLAQWWMDLADANASERERMLDDLSQELGRSKSSGQRRNTSGRSSSSRRRKTRSRAQRKAQAKAEIEQGVGGDAGA